MGLAVLQVRKWVERLNRSPEVKQPVTDLNSLDHQVFSHCLNDNVLRPILLSILSHLIPEASLWPGSCDPLLNRAPGRPRGRRGRWSRTMPRGQDDEPARGLSRESPEGAPSRRCCDGGAPGVRGA